MKHYLTFSPKWRLIVFLVAGLFMSAAGWAQLPTAQQVASQMKVGWNLGNTLEAICGETAWGNPTTTQSLINAVKAAGFNTVRLPCAWDCHATNGVIDATWLARVKQVVDYCINANLYVIINVHWDNGWLENNVTTSAQASVNAKQKSYWTQIANYFKSYNERLLFAGANEPNVSDATGMSVLLSYHQTFIDAVRATGGNNSSRTLIIQGPSTDIEKTNSLMNSMPTDAIANRLMVEVHYYTPYQLCLMTEDASWGNMFYYWGSGYHSTTDVTRNATWGEEADVEKYLGMMKTKFVDKGIPVIIGEYGVIKRSLSGTNLSLHLASREYYYKYFVKSAVSKGIIPFNWDTGPYGTNTMGIFDRNTGAIVDQGILNGIMQGAGGSTTTYTLSTSTSGTGSVSLSPTGGSYSSGTVVTVTATAGSGWQFSGWSGDLSGTTNPATVTMSGNKSVVATFTQQQSTTYTLTVSVSGQGSVSTSPSGGSYTSGTSVTLTATPASGYQFVSWSGSITGTANPTTVVMNANKTVTATFQASSSTCSNPVTITVPFSKDGAGTFCWVTSSPMAYINSWNLNSLKVNGVSFTNVYASSLPAAQNGKWYIEYNGSYAWSHFEAAQVKSALLADEGTQPSGGDNHVSLFPNPFTQSISVEVGDPAQVSHIVILDQLGRPVETIGHSDIKKSQEIGALLKAGMYIVQVQGASKLQSFKVIKN